ncbi:AAC(3) family N-acetyltransferase [Streptomyces sp. NPDC002680]|uniref:AAC(3) family N-acetyltransferase n=1 Tax=Streptomyces sp. NPDC002680 TaxID=3364659 RepID=UPI003692FC5A
MHNQGGLPARRALSARPAFEDERVQRERGFGGGAPEDGTGRGGGGEKNHPAAQLRDVLAELPIQRTTPLLVHASLHGTTLPPTLVRDTLLTTLGPAGTLIVPAFTPENSDTSRQYRAATEGMTDHQKATFRASMPPFEPATTPCPSMGALAECVRTTPGAVRSTHPQTSFAGLGPRAAELLGHHDPHCHLGERSPLAELYAADAQVLLLRVGFEVCSAFHLAEYRTTPPPPRRTYRCVVGSTGNWISYEDLALDDSDFGVMGKRLPRELVVEREWAGKAVALFGMRAVVDHAVDQMAGYRTGMT